MVDEDSGAADQLLSTGIDTLDNTMGGGVPAGSAIVVVAPPDSQANLIPYSLAATADSRLHYISSVAGQTNRIAANIEHLVDHHDQTDADPNPSVVAFDPTEYEVDPYEGVQQDLFDRLKIQETDRRPAFVVDDVLDYVTHFEQRIWWPFLRDIIKTIQNTNTLGYLLVRASSERELADARRVLNAADGVFKYSSAEEERAKLVIGRLDRASPGEGNFPITTAIEADSTIDLDVDTGL